VDAGTADNEQRNSQGACKLTHRWLQAERARACSRQFVDELVLNGDVMADNSGGIGVMGVLVGALIVIVVGGGILYATGTIGPKSPSVTIELPKVIVR
jgi:hypothetical protein